MDIQFLPNRLFQAPRPFIQQYLPGYLSHGRPGSVYYPKSWYGSGRGSRRAASILQNHFEELYDYGTSTIFPHSLEKLWSRDYDYFATGDTWGHQHAKAPFSSVFADLALFLSPDGDLSSEYFFRLMSNFLMRHFPDMLDVSPQTAMICFSALDWMGHPMGDVCATVGQDMGCMLDAMEEFPLPFPLRPHTEELLDEMMAGGRRSRMPWRPAFRMDPWCFPEDGQAVYTIPRRPRMMALEGPRHRRMLQLPRYTSLPTSQTGSRPYYLSARDHRQTLLLGPGSGYQNGHTGLPFLRHPHGNGYRLRLLT